MEYDKKDMMAWVKGNDVLLDIYLYEWVDAETRQAFNLQLSDNVKVRLVNTFGRTFDIEALPLDGHDNGLVIDILGVYPCGTYSVEITLVRGGRHVRSFESPMFRIVERNADANMTFDIVSGGRRADTEIEMQMVANAVARGKNAYELWLEAGHTGTLQEYLDQFWAPKRATQVEDGLMSFEDKKKLDSFEVLTPEETQQVFNEVFNQ